MWRYLLKSIRQSNVRYLATLNEQKIERILREKFPNSRTVSVTDISGKVTLFFKYHRWVWSHVPGACRIRGF